MTSEITEAMLPCPFCGGRADRPNPHHAHGGMVSCQSCGAEAFGPKWNRRALASQAAQIASLSAKVAEVERERDEARLSAQAIGDQLGQDIDRLTRSLAAAEARASELQREVERLSVRAGRLEKALRTIADWRDHDSRPEDGELEAFARAALQQEGESDDQG